jgi:hypothetical protein
MATLDELKKLAMALKNGAVNQYEQGAPYRDALAGALQGNFGPAKEILTKKTMVNPMTPQEGLDIALNYGPMALGTFAGVGAKTADLASLQKAKDLMAKGVTDREAWSQTGWTHAFPDGKPRFEIDDSKSFYDTMAAQDIKSRDGFNPSKDTLPLDNVVSHKELFSAYPDLANLQTHFFPKSRLGEAYGAYSPKLDRLTFADDVVDEGKGLYSAIHEMQHAVQQREGFQGGSSPKAMGSLEDYARLAGEAEARLTQKRMNMTAEQRANSYPIDMFDIPVAKQIIK